MYGKWERGKRENGLSIGNGYNFAKFLSQRKRFVSQVRNTLKLFPCKGTQVSLSQEAKGVL
jgi:hypothetical protein